MKEIKNIGLTVLLFIFGVANAQPIVDFDFATVCENSQMPVNYVFNSNNDSIVAYDWDFDNNGQFNDGSGEIAFYTFIGNGDFTVGLRVITDKGDTGFIYKSVTVLPIPKADFSVDDVCVYTKINPKDSSNANGSELKYHVWTFNSSVYPDSLTTSPSWVFDTSGIYLIELKLVTTDGCVALVKKNVNIYPNPVSDFVSSSNCLGDTSVFSENVKIESGYITKYQWDFNGDKIYDDAEGEESKYGFFSTGHELIGLRAISDKGCVHDTIKTISVYPRPHASFIVATSCENQKALFSNLSYTSISTLKYLWDFGNGDTSSVFEPPYSFSAQGEYTVKLLVENYFGCTDSIEKVHTVLAQPIADFSYSDVCLGEVTSFSDMSQSVDKIQSRIWDFADGNGEVASQPKHLYDAPGTYAVFLRIETEAGCVDTMQKSVQVFSLPETSISVSSQQICDGDSARLDGIGLNGKTFIWSTASTNPFIYVHKQDHYDLTVFDANNCSVKKGVDITVNPNPKFLHSGDTSITAGVTLNLTAEGLFDFEWTDPQLEKLSQNALLSITPKNSTEYVVQGTNEFGCSTSYPVKVEVIKDYNLSPNNLITPNNDGKNETWTVTNISAYNDCKVIIFNRWGQQVFHSAVGYNNDWNGKDDNGKELPDGGYFYIIHCDGMQKDITGPVTILRSKE